MGTLFGRSRRSRRQTLKTETDISAKWLEELSAHHEVDTEHKSSVLSTPWQALNRAIGELRAGELVVVASRPSMGKSTFAINLMASIVLSGKRVLMFNLETQAVSIYNRLIASEMEVPLEWLRAAGTGRHRHVDYWSQVTEGVRCFKGSGLLVNDQSGLDAKEIVSEARRAHLQVPLDLVIIDPLGLVKDKHHDYLDICKGNTIKAFKSLAKELSIPVAVVSRLNERSQMSAWTTGDGSQKNKRPEINQLPASDAIEQNADIIIFLHRHHDSASGEAHHTDYPGWIELSIAKQREGESGQTIWLRDRLDIGKLEDYDGPSPKKQTVSRGGKQE